MKIKTSITLTADLVRGLKELEKEFKNRSQAIDAALRYFIEQRRQAARDARDIAIINANASQLNREAAETLEYQESNRSRGCSA